MEAHGGLAREAPRQRAEPAEGVHGPRFVEASDRRGDVRLRVARGNTGGLREG